MIFSCGKEEDLSEFRDCQDVEYDKEIEITLSDKICFPDGNSFTFERIEHQFCPCDAVCIWAGDLYIKLLTTTENNSEDKFIYPSLMTDNKIFTNHEIASLVYTYGTENEDVPLCAEDFVPEKITLILTVS